MKKFLKISGITFGTLLLIVIAYVIYVFAAYERVEDNAKLEVVSSQSPEKTVPTGEKLSITSWNIGFGAYTDEYSFFMDGGEHSRGFSEEIVYDTVQTLSLIHI